MNMIYEINALTATLILIILGALVFVIGWIVWNVLPKRTQKKIDSFIDRILK